MGWHGLSWYSDTTKLYAKFKEEIWEYLTEKSENHGYSNPFEYLSIFCNAASICDAATMENRLIGYAAERMAYQITQRQNSR